MYTRINDMSIRRIYFALFAVSGFSGLIYESIWTHYLKLFLGHAAYAQTLVLTIFMGGMALGSWWAARYGRNIRSLLLSYAMVEGIIGLLALGFHPVFVVATNFSFSTIIPALPSPGAVQVFKWTMAAGLILPQSVLLGTTFPMMSAGLIRRFRAEPGKALAILYFTNSLGAAVGILVCGFVFIETVGLPGAVSNAGMLNITVAMLVWLLAKKYGADEGAVATPATGKTVNTGSTLVYRVFLACALLTGTASFLYEIGWIRMLCLVLSSSTHSFELMLSSFILGLALGGYWIKGRIDNLANPLWTLGVIQLVMGALALLTLPMYDTAFYAMDFALSALARSEQGYLLFNIFSHGLSMAIMLPTTICAGMTLPLITYCLVSRGYGERSIGGVYAANTAGAIMGIIVGVQFIMPVSGVKNLITVGGGIDILLGLALAKYSSPGVKPGRLGAITLVAVAFYAAIIFGVELDTGKMSSGVFRYGLKSRRDKVVVFHKDGKTASVDLVRSKGGKLTISTNGKPDAAIGADRVSADEPTMILLGALPLSIHGQAKTVATIGLGSGLTSHTLLSMPSIELVDTIEIEPAMVQGAKGFGERVARVYNDPRSHIYIEDAKTFFTSGRKTYDLIVSEPSNPWVSGVAGLFSVEFYRLVRNYIADDGLFTQWLHLYELDVSLVASVVKAISMNFGDYVVYFTTDGDMVIIASKNGNVGEPDGAIFAVPELNTALQRIGVTCLQDISLRKLGDKYTLDPLFYTFSVKPNSDYFPVLDLGAARTRFLGSSADELQDILTSPLPVIEVLGGKPPLALGISTGENPYYKASKRAAQALAVYRFFLDPSRPYPEKTGSDTQVVVRNVRAIHGNLRPGEMEKGWAPYFKQLASMTIPYLSAQEMDVIWGDIKSAPGFDDMPQVVLDWVRLFMAVSGRDLALAAQYAEKLAPAGEIIPTPDNNYLLAVSMLAGIVTQDMSKADMMWDRYSGKMTAPIQLRLLKMTSLRPNQNRRNR